MNKSEGGIKPHKKHILDQTIFNQIKFKFNLLPKILILQLCIFNVSAQNNILDSWSTFQRTEVVGSVGSNFSNVVVDATAMGGEREQYVEITQTSITTRRISLLADGGELAFGLESDVNGFSVNIYDGTGDGAIDNDLGDADPFTPSFAPGLNIDLEDSSCLSADRGFTIIASGAAEGDVDIVFDLFTTASDWSQQIITIAQNSAEGVIFFPHTSFVTQGGTGVDFNNVDAIRLTISPDAVATDITFSRPLSSCGVDLGDAAGSLFGGGLVVDSRLSANGPIHTIAGPKLGSIIDAETTTSTPVGLGEGIGIADNDDLSGAGPDDNDGITFPAPLSPGFNVGDTFTVTADVSNVLDVDGAFLCGWIDFSDISGFLGFGFEDVAEERVCTSVDSTLSNCTSTGATSTQCTLDFTIPADFNGINGTPAGGQDGAFLARFRVTTDWSVDSDATYNGSASDGEVEDYLISNSTLPVSIHSFDSIYSPQGLHVFWETASETRNAGFNIWGNIDGQFKKLNTSMIPSNAKDALSPEKYEIIIPDVKANQVTSLVMSTIDIKGKEKVYDSFEVSEVYGLHKSPALIDWQKIGEQVDVNMNQKGFVKTSTGWKQSNKHASTKLKNVNELFVNAHIEQNNMQRISFEDLLLAGMDLTGVNVDDIAVTLKDQAVARSIVHIDSIPHPDVVFENSFNAEIDQSVFGPGFAIDFWAQKPELPGALYIENQVYRVEVNSELASDVQYKNSHQGKTMDSYKLTQLFSEENYYHSASPSTNPWSAKLLKASDSTYQVDMQVPENWISNQPSQLVATVTGLTDLEANPDHQVSLNLNGQQVNLTTFDGRQSLNITANLSAGIINAGNNQLSTELTDGTEALFDMVMVENMGLIYDMPLIANSNLLIMNNQQDIEYFQASGFDSQIVSGYGLSQSGDLYNLDVKTLTDDKYSISGLAEIDASYWISTQNKFNSPTLATALVKDDLVADVAEFLIIAHPAFMPVDENEVHPLNEFINTRQSQGWTVRLISILDIQSQYGGMATPEALNKFIKSADLAFDFSHVLLVGGDSYDYHNNLGLGSLSFIPTAYIETEIVKHSPNDQVMMDVDADGVADKSIGRWPVRTMNDLTAIVQKTFDWENNLAADQTVAWVVDKQDSDTMSLKLQANRVLDKLSGWNQDVINYDLMVPTNGFSQADLTRDALFNSLENGKTFTSFNGHASPTTWSQSRILSASDIVDLDNSGLPTVVIALACYTNYFVSPYADSLSNMLMNSTLDDNGQVVEGVYTGAAAIHGAITLSDYAQNEIISKIILERQLLGDSIGDAISYARNNINHEVRKTWTLLGDPTLQVQ